MNTISEIEINNRLLADGYITKKQHKRLIHDGIEVIDNSNAGFEIVGDDVYVHGCGAYPLILKDYAS